MLKNVNQQQKQTSGRFVNLGGEDLLSLAMKSITPEMVLGLEMGEGITLISGVELYRYEGCGGEEDDFHHVVLIEDEEEVFCVMTDGNEVEYVEL